MAIKFYLHETPQPNSRKGDKLVHARAINSGTIKMDEICQHISTRSTVSSADVKAVLDSFTYEIQDALEKGCHIELDDLGIFSPSVRTINQAGGKIKPMVNGVNFRCSEKLKKDLANTSFSKMAQENSFSPEECKSRMMDYLAKNDHISAASYARINKCSRYQATNDLNKYIKEGVIKKIGAGTRKTYLLNK